MSPLNRFQADGHRFSKGFESGASFSKAASSGGASSAAQTKIRPWKIFIGMITPQALLISGLLMGALCLRTLLTATFHELLVPLIVFFSLQKHFVRGLLAGSVKG